MLERYINHQASRLLAYDQALKALTVHTSDIARNFSDTHHHTLQNNGGTTTFSGRSGNVEAVKAFFKSPGTKNLEAKAASSGIQHFLISHKLVEQLMIDELFFIIRSTDALNPFQDTNSPSGYQFSVKAWDNQHTQDFMFAFYALSDECLEILKDTLRETKIYYSQCIKDENGNNVPIFSLSHNYIADFMKHAENGHKKLSSAEFQPFYTSHLLDSHINTFNDIVTKTINHPHNHLLVNLRTEMMNAINETDPAKKSCDYRTAREIFFRMNTLLTSYSSENQKACIDLANNLSGAGNPTLRKISALMLAIAAIGLGLAFGVHGGFGAITATAIPASVGFYYKGRRTGLSKAVTDLTDKAEPLSKAYNGFL